MTTMTTGKAKSKLMAMVLALVLVCAVALAGAPAARAAAGDSPFEPIEHDVNSDTLVMEDGRYYRAFGTGDKGHALPSGEATLVLDGVTIDTTGGGSSSPVYVEAGATLNLILRGANSLQGGVSGPGIWVVPGGVLNIYAEDGGSLTATGGTYNAGIGGDASGGCGTVNIYSGTVTANGGAYGGAGIGGGGANSGVGGAGGEVNIYGGDVTANGADGGAGIGGGGTGSGAGGAGGSYTQYEGMVRATGGAGLGSGGGAGVGGGGGRTGVGGASGAITLYGGTLVAVGGAGESGSSPKGGGAGMGGGAAGPIAIFGGAITATGGAGGDSGGTYAGGGGAGIGGGGGGYGAGAGGTLAADQIYLQNGVNPTAAGGAGGSGLSTTGGRGASVGNGGDGRMGIGSNSPGTEVPREGNPAPPSGSALNQVWLNGLPLVADPDDPTMLTLELPAGHNMDLSNVVVSYAASPGASVTDFNGGGAFPSGTSADFAHQFQDLALEVTDFGGGSTAEYYLFIISGPEIVGQPQNATAAPGGSAGFTVNAPSAIFYEWWVMPSGDNFVEPAGLWTPPAGVNVSGADTATLTLSGLPESMSGYKFFCFAQNADGWRKSEMAVLTVQNPPPAQAAETGEQTTPTGGSPQTGDGSAPGPWALLGAAALGGLAVCAGRRRRARSK